MDLHILTPDTVNDQLDLLAEFHAVRHRIFVETLQRKDLNSTQKFEYDLWDTPLFEPVRFLLKLDGEAIGAARMISSRHMTMFEAKYSEFLDNAHEKRDTLWEIQRLGVRLDLDPRVMEMAILELLIGIHEWSTTNGIRDVMLMTFTGIAAKRLQTMTPMGQAKMHMGAEYIALQSGLSAPLLLEWKRRLEHLKVPRIQRVAA